MGLSLHLEEGLICNQEFCSGHIMLRCLMNVPVEVLWRQVICKSRTQGIDLKLKYKFESSAYSWYLKEYICSIDHWKKWPFQPQSTLLKLMRKDSGFTRQYEGAYIRGLGLITPGNQQNHFQARGLWASGVCLDKQKLWAFFEEAMGGYRLGYTESIKDFVQFHWK